MALEGTTFGWGLARYPLTTGGTRTLLQDADPVLYLILDYVATVVSTYAGARWDEAWAAARPVGPSTPARPIVAQVVPYDPGPTLRENQYKFPLLAVYREETKYEDVTIEFEHGETRFVLAWCLPPLRPSEMELLLPMRYAVEQVVRERLTMGHDASYRSDAAVFDGVLEYVGIEKALYASAPGADAGILFPTVVMDLVVTEQQERPFAGQYDLVDGADVAVDLAPAVGDILLDAATFRSNTTGFSSAFSSAFR